MTQIISQKIVLKNKPNHKSQLHCKVSGCSESRGNKDSDLFAKDCPKSHDLEPNSYGEPIARILKLFFYKYNEINFK